MTKLSMVTLVSTKFFLPKLIAFIVNEKSAGSLWVISGTCINTMVQASDMKFALML